MQGIFGARKSTSQVGKKLAKIASRALHISNIYLPENRKDSNPQNF
jgi:hypothetical protein